MKSDSFWFNWAGYLISNIMEEYLYLIFLSECINIIFIRLILCLLFFEFDYLLIKFIIVYLIHTCLIISIRGILYDKLLPIIPRMWKFQKYLKQLGSTTIEQILTVNESQFLKNTSNFKTNFHPAVT